MTDNAANMLKAFNMDDLFDEEWKGFLAFADAETDHGNPEQEQGDSLDLDPLDEESLDNFEEDDVPVRRPKHLSCVAHTLQLVVNDGIKCDNNALNVSRYLEKLTEFFNRRGHWRSELKKIADKDLVKPVKTRWNSLFFGLQRLCEVLL